MEALLSSLKDTVSLVADNKVILGGAGSLALLSISGVIPRVGVVRAFTYGWRNYFKKTYPLSIRKSEIKLLNDTIKSIEKGSYIIVIGEKGNGKSCFIDTALNHHHGVSKISTKSGAGKSLIVDQVFREITGIESDFFDLVGSARRVLFFYSLLFKFPPTVVIRVPDRQVGQCYADLTSAVRSLADDFRLRVIVDGSPNSIPPELLTTNRETVITIEPMSREQIESIPVFKGLINFLKTHQLDCPVWKVLGGSPTKYLKLKEMIDRLFLSNTATDVIIEQVKNHLQSIFL